MFSQITPIILVSIDRHTYLDRIQSYYSKLNYDKNIIIADGSLEKWPGSSSSNSVYLHLPGVSYQKRLQECLKVSKSEFVAILADDDFLVPSGLELCTQFLEKNINYACAHGYYVRFVIENEKVRYSHKHSREKSIFDENAYERIKKAFIPKYIPHVYAVHRRKNLEIIFNYDGMNDYEYLFNYEMLVTYSSLLNGKSKRLPVIYVFREMGNQKVSVTGSNLRMSDIDVMLKLFRTIAKQILRKESNPNMMHLIDAAATKHYEYYDSFNNENVLKHNNVYDIFKAIVLYCFSSIIKLRNKIIMNPLPIHDANTKSEFQSVNNVLQQWIIKQNNSIKND
jgi:glycosyltransferase domain-containing protein